MSTSNPYASKTKRVAAEPKTEEVVTNAPETASVKPNPEVVETVEVPVGTADEILAWVGDDKERAKLALDAEKAAKKPRKGLSEELTEIIG